MRLIDADVLKQDLSKFYDGIITARELVDRQPTVKQPKEQKAEYPVCEKCGKEIEHINTSVFRYDGSDSDRSIPITYSKENGCVLFSTNQNWTGYYLTEEERKDRIRCPYCGKFPFNNSTKIEVHIPLTVDVMMWTSEGQ